MRTASLAIACWVSLNGSTLAACDPPAPVRFPPNAVATDLHGGIARGDVACFTIRARQGQALSVTQPDNPHSNIAIQVYRPPWHIGDDQAAVPVSGTPLNGAEDGADAKQWFGRLPVSGSYLLMVGTIRGGDAYRLHVEIR